MPVSLRQIGNILFFGLLFAVLGFHIIRSAVDLWTAECPAYDGITDQAAALAACPDGHR